MIREQAMRTREIPYDQWESFFSDFTDLHRGEHINVETMSAENLNVEARLRDLPLVGIVSAQPKTETEQEEWIDVIGCDAPGTHATHTIANPSKLRLAEEEDGQAVALQIESADASITMIRFEPPRENMPPGFLISS
jgi:hypothetical protein